MIRTIRAYFKARRQQDFLRGFAQGLEHVKAFGKIGAIQRMEEDIAMGACIGTYEQGMIAALTR